MRSLRESHKSLTLHANDYKPTCVYAARFINHDPTMSFVCHDDYKNHKSFQYAPNDTESWGGNTRVFRIDYNMCS